MLKYKLLHGWLLPPIRNCLARGSEYRSVQVTGIYAAPNGDHQYTGNMEHLDSGFPGFLPCRGTGKYMGRFSS